MDNEAELEKKKTEVNREWEIWHAWWYLREGKGEERKNGYRER